MLRLCRSRLHPSAVGLFVGQLIDLRELPRIREERRFRGRFDEREI
jgi:hypothetical protein